MDIIFKLALIDWLALLCLLALGVLAIGAEAGLLGEHKRVAGASMLGLVSVFIVVLLTSNVEDSVLFGDPEKQEKSQGKKKQAVAAGGGGEAAPAAEGESPGTDGSGPGDGAGGNAELAAGEGKEAGGGKQGARKAGKDGKDGAAADQDGPGDVAGGGGGADDPCAAGKPRPSGQDGGKAASTTPRAGAGQQDCPHCPRLAYVPRGCYDIGAPAAQPGYRPEEGPVTRIKVRKPFYIGRYEVTRGEFEAFVVATGHRASSACVVDGRWTVERTWQSPGLRQDKNHPVVCVSWLDASSYVEWLTRTTGQSYRLPTEAEWEYAARAGSKSNFPSGDKLEPADANFGGTADGTLPVGQFTPNAWGLADMAGNVWELVEDCWEPSHVTMREDGAARTSGLCDRRVMRGGAWYNSPRFMRSASRWSNPESAAGNGVGFRVAREIGRSAPVGAQRPPVDLPAARGADAASGQPAEPGAPIASVGSAVLAPVVIGGRPQPAPAPLRAGPERADGSAGRAANKGAGQDRADVAPAKARSGRDRHREHSAGR